MWLQIIPVRGGWEGWRNKERNADVRFFVAFRYGPDGDSLYDAPRRDRADVHIWNRAAHHVTVTSVLRPIFGGDLAVEPSPQG